MLVESLAPHAVQATEAEWQSWFTSIPQDLGRPMINEVLMGLARQRAPLRKRPRTNRPGRRRGSRRSRGSASPPARRRK
eukprot:3492637-Alexandrium_andersonii.AAC.1